jgi:hypothetical protein
MDILIEMDNREFNLGEVLIERVGSKNLGHSGLPFKETKDRRGNRVYKYQIICYAHCERSFLFVVDFRCKDKTWFVLVQCALEPRVGLDIMCDSVVDSDPTKIINMFLNGLKRYSNRKGNYDYVRMFKNL